MTSDRAPGKLVSWIRSKTWGLATAVVCLCLSLSGCSGTQRAPLVREPVPDVPPVSALMPCSPLAQKDCDETPEGQYALAKLLEEIVPPDTDEGIKKAINDRIDLYLDKKAEEIGEYPFPNLSDDEKRIYGLVKLAADSGLSEAQNRLGTIFLYNTEFMKKARPSDPENLCKDSRPRPAPDMYAKEAFDWFQKAANPSANNLLGMMYMYDIVVGDRSYDAFQRCQKALHFFRQAAQAYDPDALRNLGTMYEYGHGLEKNNFNNLEKNNFREAMRYHHLSAELGYPRSQFTLAEKYLFMHKGMRESLRKDPKHEVSIKSLEKIMGDYANAPELTKSEDYFKRWLLAFDETCKTVRRGSGEYRSCKNTQELDSYKVYQKLGLLDSTPHSGWSKKSGIKTGTGFVVHLENTDVGHYTYILTNAHVVTQDWEDDGPHWENIEKPEYSEVRIIFENSAFPVFSPAKVVERSPHHDLALLKVRDVAERASGAFRPKDTKLVLGEKSYAFGYPHADTLSFEMHATEGNVSATAGEFSDPSTFETESPIRSGNSGGPILDSKGQVIGVAVSTLSFSQKETTEITPRLQLELFLPKGEQNFNFAISHKAVHDFFDRLKNEGKIDFTLEPDREAPSLELEAIAEKTRDFTVLVQCWK